MKSPKEEDQERKIMIKFSSFKQIYSGIVIRTVNSMLHHLIKINNIVHKDKQQKLNDALMCGKVESNYIKSMDEKKKIIFNNLHARSFSFSKITRKIPHVYPKVKKDEM